MNEFANPAQRVSRLIEKVVHKQDGISIAAVWAEAFGLDPKASEADPHEVLAKLMVLRQEIDLAEKLMSETTFSKELYAPYLKRVRSTVSLKNISAQWGNHKNNLQADTRLALKFCAEILIVEPELSQEALQKVLDSVHCLRKEIEESELTLPVREFLLSQLAIIEKGIQDYPIRGGVAIKNAFNEGFVDCATHAKNINSNENHDAISKIGHVWGAFKSAGKEFVEADRIATSLAGMADKGRALIELLN
jgi:hypothetical protein